MSRSEDLVQQAKDRIDEIFADKSATLSETKEKLEDIIDHAQTCVYAIEDDLRRDR